MSTVRSVVVWVPFGKALLVFQLNFYILIRIRNSCTYKSEYFVFVARYILLPRKECHIECTVFYDANKAKVVTDQARQLYISKDPT